MQFCECYCEAITTVVIYTHIHTQYIFFIHICRTNQEDSKERTRKMEVYGDYSETAERRQLV